MVLAADGLNNIRAPAPVEAPGSVATIGEVRQELYQRALQRLVGQSLEGQVLSRYTDGSFLVKFADTAARVILPPNTQIGDSLPLTLVSVQPRPTFLLGSDADKLGKSPLVYLDPHGSEEVELSGAAEEPPPGTPQTRTPATNLARQFQQIDSLLRPSDRIATDGKQSSAADLASGGLAHSAQASLSNAGQLINNLLQAAQQQGAPAALQGKVAILPQPNTATPQVAAALQDTLAYSGLFYESHVHEWADGKRPIAELLREPQMQQAAKGDGASGTRLNGNDNLAFPQLVNLQLGTLEQQATHWRGEIWPGQNMEWDVQREPQQNTSGGKDPDQAWQSTVRFELPGLGSITASLHLLGEHLHIQVQTGSERSASLLREHAAELATALDAAGSPLDSLLVQRNEQA